MLSSSTFDVVRLKALETKSTSPVHWSDIIHIVGGETSTSTVIWGWFVLKTVNFMGNRSLMPWKDNDKRQAASANFVHQFESCVFRRFL
jgi:hypothetical protein